MIYNIRFDIYLGKVTITEAKQVCLTRLYGLASVLRWKYWNTSLKVLQYFLRSTEVIP